MRKDTILKKEVPDLTRISTSSKIMVYVPVLLATIIIYASYGYVSGEVTTMFSEMLRASIYFSGGAYLLATLLSSKLYKKDEGRIE